MSSPAFASAHDIRKRFFRAMSDMYRTEVPLYGDLLDIVDSVNSAHLAEQPTLEADLKARGEYDRLGQERHGAIRVGTAAELSMLRRAFAVMGMHPVGYYDLSAAGVPVHATAFRPVTQEGLNENPFRVFTSLMRLELIQDPELRQTASDLLERRRIFTPRAVELVDAFEQCGGLDDDAADDFVREILETFRWHADTVVSEDVYQRLNAVHRLVADVACFRGPHINHLTPRTLDIDAVQAEMLRRGIDAKEVIEGPPRRDVPILLRQTSFKALEERVRFSDQRSGSEGTHTARFGEIEQRGMALTPSGRELYETLLAEAHVAMSDGQADHESVLAEVFKKFPDDEQTLRRGGLGYFNYRLVAGAGPEVVQGRDIETLIEDGIVDASPIIYEDFLPVSAAGIFQSNLGGTGRQSYAAAGDQAAFEEALGAEVADSFSLYEGIQRRSLQRISLSVDTHRPPGSREA